MININDLISSSKKINDSKINIYNKILLNCHNKIKFSSKYKLNCIFEVPKFYFGTTFYNINECLKYICSKLEINGFDIVVVPPNLLIISWKKFLNDIIPNIECKTEIYKKDEQKTILNTPEIKQEIIHKEEQTYLNYPVSTRNTTRNHKKENNNNKIFMQIKKK